MLPLFPKRQAVLAGTNTPISISMMNVISYPTVSTQITDGSASITRNFTLNLQLIWQTKSMAAHCRFKLETENFRSISATLGMGAKDAMVLAGAIAFVLVAVFVIVFYRLPGASQQRFCWGNWSVPLQRLPDFSAIASFTLTLPGIPGIVLYLGVGVDANIITAERIKEELKAGKSLDNALNIGYKRGFLRNFRWKYYRYFCRCDFDGGVWPDRQRLQRCYLLFFRWRFNYWYDLFIRIYVACRYYYELYHGRYRFETDAEIHFEVQTLPQGMAVRR